MKTLRISIGLFIALFSLTTVTAKGNVAGQVRQLLQTETLQRAEAALDSVPVTVTATRAERSAGGIHDFYSEGDYWWANPQDPEGPFVRRDGETNPDNFTEGLFSNGTGIFILYSITTFISSVPGIQ